MATDQRVLTTGITNAGSEETNFVIKTIARDAYDSATQRISGYAPAPRTRHHRGHLNPA